MGRCREPVYHNNDDDDDGIGGRDGDSTRTGNRKPKERGQRTEEQTRGRGRYGRARYNVDGWIDEWTDGTRRTSSASSSPSIPAAATRHPSPTNPPLATRDCNCYSSATSAAPTEPHTHRHPRYWILVQSRSAAGAKGKRNNR